MDVEFCVVGVVVVVFGEVGVVVVGGGIGGGVGWVVGVSGVYVVVGWD